MSAGAHSARPAAPPAAAGPPLWQVTGPAAVAVAAVLLATASRHGPHGDELYFRMLPPAWWYDDQPPLTVWLTWLAARASPEFWAQRVPAALAAAAGAVLAGLFPRLLGYGPRVQSVAAWAHGFTVYPLIVGHVFLTATLDLLAWQVVIVLVVAAMLRRRGALAWAGVAAGLACWNKLLVLVLVAALVLALLAADRPLLKSRSAALGALGLAMLGGPQVLAQALHGWPMAHVAAGLIESHGAGTRWLVAPMLVVLVGPPFVRVWARGLRWRPPESAGLPGETVRPPAPGRRAPAVLMVATVLVVAWTLANPAQGYYPLGVLLPALALGWGPTSRSGAAVWRRVRLVVAVNAAVAMVVSLPLLPVGSAGFRLVAQLNPVLRDQTDWPAYVRQVAAARAEPESDEPVAVVADTYAMAGAIAYYGPQLGIPAVASGHNALWDLGPPGAERVLLVGTIARTHRHLFPGCLDAGSLVRADADPFGVAGSPMARCSVPPGEWEAIWPHFRRWG